MDAEDGTNPENNNNLKSKIIRYFEVYLVVVNEAIKVWLNRGSVAVEIVFWAIIAVFPIIKLMNIDLGDIPFADRQRQAWSLMISYSGPVVLFPFIFHLIFQKYPLEQLRYLWMKPNKNDATDIEEERRKTLAVEAENLRIKFETTRLRIAENQVNIDRVLDDMRGDYLPEGNSPREILYFFARSSSLVAQKVYTRSNVYLIIGVVFAVGGLAVFYRISGSINDNSNLANHVLALLPNVGILFFIEFIAIFFLRQHRAAMDDFRYYD